MVWEVGGKGEGLHLSRPDDFAPNHARSKAVAHLLRCIGPGWRCRGKVPAAGTQPHIMTERTGPSAGTQLPSTPPPLSPSLPRAFVDQYWRSALVVLLFLGAWAAVFYWVTWPYFNREMVAGCLGYAGWGCGWGFLWGAGQHYKVKLL
jgi:hypothetical protein